MRPRPSKYKAVHTAAEKEYFKSLADQVRDIRLKATGKLQEAAGDIKNSSSITNPA